MEERETMEHLSQDELFDRIRIAFKSAFHIDPRTITMDTVPSDIPQWDSMGHVTLASAIEQTFDLTLDVIDLMAMEDVKEIFRIMQSKLGQAQNAQSA